MAHTWFRFYNEAIEDPKVQRLPLKIFRHWINLLCLASKHDGNLPSVSAVSFALRVNKREAENTLNFLKARGLLDKNENCFSPHNWHTRQYISDVSNERVKRFRERKRNVTVTANVTAPDTDSEQIQIQTTEQKVVVAAKAASKQGTRWPSDQLVPQEWIAAGHASRSKHLHPAADLDTEAEKFANYWSAKSGKDGTKLDWRKTWINWALTAKGLGTNGSGRHSKPTAHDNFLAGAAALLDDIDTGRS